MAAVLAGTLTACTDHPGSAAVVDGTSISDSSTLQTVDQLAADRTPAEPADPSGTAATVDWQAADVQREALNRKVLTASIRHQLLQSPAFSRLPAPPKSEVNARAAQVDPAQLAGQLGVAPDRVDQGISDALRVLTLAQQNAEQPVTDVRVSMDILSTFDSRSAAAAARVRFLDDPAALDAAIAEAAQGSGGAQSAATGQQLTLLQQPALAQFGVFSEPAGSIVVVPSGERWTLVRINHRSETPGQLGSALGTAANSQQGQASLFDLAWLAASKDVRGQTVTVNPRFGRWDPVVMQVVPLS